ncbi:aminodeoxychorismate synthase, component I [Halostella salina]|uniref:aminodeoxychorismate synthase, component I n=1 Tax=Halostella salina TaxID=1547897 RepID=UPI000EF77901|nr:aminodeoxychorismate synthase, component I [Halostella salina]
MTDPVLVTDRASYRRTAAAAPSNARVPVEVQIRVSDPFTAYRRARRGDGGDAYLATTGGQSGWGHFAVDPVERVSIDVSDADDDSASRAAGSRSLGALADLLDGERLVRGDCDVPYPCGVVGWLSYDIARELEDLPDATADDRGLPRLQVAAYDRLATWEEPRDGDGSDGVVLRVTACPRVDGDPDDTFDRGRDRAMALAREAVDGDRGVEPPPADADEVTFESDCGRETFAERVRTVKQRIRDGETFQTNVSQRLTAPAAVHPVAAFDALREVNPAPYSALLEFPGVDLVSASPELLLEREGDRVRTEPIAGTRPRGDTAAADERLEADLTSDEKERAEHAMLVDLERNDLGKVCAYGSVAVEEYRRVDRYAEVMHLVSSVAGTLRDDATLADAVAATFPGGTITGAPKPRTMAIIDEVEATRRGPYTGSVGIFGFDGRATLNIVIRTLVRHGDEYGLRVGAGVVDDSDPDSEYDETLDKARALVTAVDEALGDRATLAVEGGDGRDSQPSSATTDGGPP